MTISWSQALAWRMRRHLLEPAGTESVEAVVGRLGAVLAMDERLAELAVRARRLRSGPGEVARALDEGRIIKSFAFRGATHYLSAEDGGAYLALRASGRQWEIPSWQEYYDLKPADWPAFRETIREALADGPLTVADLGAAVTRKAAYRHLRPVFDQGADTLIKPLTWQGDMSFGPPRDGRHTFQRLDDNPHWAGIWDLDEAGPHAITSYFRAYGRTEEHIHYWLGAGLSAGRKRLRSWLTAHGSRRPADGVDHRRRDRLHPHRRPRRPVGDAAHERRATAARSRSVGHRPGHQGPACRPTGTPHTGHAQGEPRDRGRHCEWHMDRHGEPPHSDMVRREGNPPRKALDTEAARLARILDRPLKRIVNIA